MKDTIVIEKRDKGWTIHETEMVLKMGEAYGLLHALSVLTTHTWNRINEIEAGDNGKDT